MTVVDVLAVADARADAPAIVASGEVWSYDALDHAVSVRTRGTSDVAAGSMVPLVARADVGGVVELLAIWRRGAIPVPLNPRLGAGERARAEGALATVRPPTDTQVILWTSGTSGRPRGVALSWANLESSARGAAERLGLGSEDVWLASLSPAHVGGLAMITRSLLLGGTLLLDGPFDVARVSGLLDGVGSATPTHLALVPTQLYRLLEERGGRPAPGPLRCVLIGGAYAPRPLVERAVDLGWPVALTYGATEMSSQIATAAPEIVRRTEGTVGLPMPGVEVTIDASGEVLTRGPTRALGYVATGAPEIADVDGWYRTGDLGRIDDEGNLWITGRRIDRIVSGGVTIDAVEVEEALRSHPAVLDACVVGIPDEEWGERVGAWVVPVVGEFDLEEAERHLRSQLAGAKLPRIWHVAGDLPRNANGKVDRAAVRAAVGSPR